jgi:F-type H+-transporting ATPase subunit delta
MSTPTPSQNLRAKKVKAYADAFVKIIRTSDSFDETAVAFEELSEMLTKSPNLKNLLISKHRGTELKSKVMHEIGTRAQLGAGVEGLVDALAGNNDLALLPDVVKAVLHTTREEIVIAHITTARALDDAQAKKLKERLQDKFNKRVELKVKEDPELLGGLTVQVGDTVIDGSLRGRLDRLRDQLLKPPGK